MRRDVVGDPEPDDFLQAEDGAGDGSWQRPGGWRVAASPGRAVVHPDRAADPASTVESGLAI
jgi:hypothetical protein